MKKNKLQKKLQKFFSSGFRGFVAVSLVIGLLSGNVVSVKAGNLGNYGDSDFSFPKFSELNGIRNSDKFNNGENCIYKWGGTSMVYIGKVSSSTSGSCSSNVILKSDLYNKIYNTDFLKIDGGNISLKGIPGKYFTKIYNWVYEDIKPCPDGTYNTGSLVHRCESDSFKENGKYGYHTSTGLFIIPQAGQYFNENGKDIKPCPDGTYQDE
ncbi:hypothetical protein LR002_03225, partial [Candidatus Gracilibacteria bacterium]|nr:hypothetical protein [Candidatus Gracilibacteria bacterium]